MRSLAQSTTPFLASGKAKNGVCSLRIAHIALFYTINFFSDSPERFALLLGQCPALRSLAQSRTPFLASGKAKNGVCSLRMADITLFYTINFFFLIAPRDLHYYWASAQPCSVNNTFFSLWEGQKWGLFPKDRTYRAFLHNKLFFLIAPRDLHYYWASAQPCAALLSQQHLF